MAESITLNADDPFESAIIDLVEMNRRKRADYATEEDVFVNFRRTSDFAGFEAPWLSALFNCAQKQARITALRENGKLEDPTNESVGDTVLDNAVYAVIGWGMYKQERDKYSARFSGAWKPHVSGEGILLVDAPGTRDAPRPVKTGKTMADG